MEISSIMNQKSAFTAASKVQAPENVDEAKAQEVPETEANAKAADAKRFDRFEKSGEKPAIPEEGQKPEMKECTVNTDSVDAEIRKLKEEIQEVQQKLQSEDRGDQRKSLEQRLTQLESELQTKDNDAYRKQNASYTSE